MSTTAKRRYPVESAAAMDVPFAWRGEVARL
jgi:hypothetical protein